jgi:pimeloyl-ACP methyl ester carboxylesterase
LSGGVALTVEVRGDGTPVVLLPWFGLSHAVMAAAFEPIFTQVEDWRRIYVDLPGTGTSPPVAPASDAVLDAVQNYIAPLDRFVLAGCSYGGYLAAGLARRIPARIAGLLLVCSGVKILPEQRDLSGALASSPEPGWLDATPERLHSHLQLAVGHQTRDVVARIARAVDGEPPSDERYLDALRSTGYQLGDEGSTARYDGPVLLVAGRSDRVAGYRDQFDALGNYPRGSYAAVAEAGHYLPFEQPERFTSLVLDWLGQVERGATQGSHPAET